MTAFPITRFFKTFTSDAYPVEPAQELSLEQAMLLTTYYEAGYDGANRLREFVKRLRERDPSGGSSWVTLFVEGYEYWPSGRLKVRRLTTRNGATRTWTFEDKGDR